MFQELGAGQAVLRGATVCLVVEETEERGVQLKQSTTDTDHTILLVYTDDMGCQTSTQAQYISINTKSTHLFFSCLF